MFQVHFCFKSWTQAICSEAKVWATMKVLNISVPSPQTKECVQGVLQWWLLLTYRSQQLTTVLYKTILLVLIWQVWCSRVCWISSVIINSVITLWNAAKPKWLELDWNWEKVPKNTKTENPFFYLFFTVLVQSYGHVKWGIENGWILVVAAPYV